MAEKIDNSFEDIIKKLVPVALPIALQNFIAASLNLVDNLMVGSLGEDPLAAVGVSIQIFFIFWLILFGFTSGCATFMAQLYGAKKIKNLHSTLGFALTITITIGLFFSFVTMVFPNHVIAIFTDKTHLIEIGSKYVRIGAPTFIFMAITVPLSAALRTSQQTKIPMIISIMAFAINTFLNYCFIFGNFGLPKLGVVGAAFATCIARFIEASSMIYMTMFRENIIKDKIKNYFKWDSFLARKVLYNAWPTTINETMWSIGTATYVAIYARTATYAYAAFQASATINSLFTLAAFSIGDAILILVGEKLGQNKLDEAYKLASKLMKIAIVVGIVFGVTLFLVSPYIIEFFNFARETKDIALMIIRVFSISMALTIYNACIITGILRCGGDTRYAMIAETITMWCVGVPLAMLGTFYLQLPIYFTVLLVKIEEIVKVIILARRTLSKKWLNNVVLDIYE